jgi:hypothetical protein
MRSALGAGRSAKAGLCTAIGREQVLHCRDFVGVHPLCRPAVLPLIGDSVDRRAMLANNEMTDDSPRTRHVSDIATTRSCRSAFSCR